jgi:hypothetical protein
MGIVKRRSVSGGSRKLTIEAITSVPSAKKLEPPPPTTLLEVDAEALRAPARELDLRKKEAMEKVSLQALWLSPYPQTVVDAHEAVSPHSSSEQQDEEKWEE